MKEYYERRRIRKLLHSRYAIVFLMLIMFILARAVWGIHAKYEKSKDMAQKIESDLADLEARKAQLAASIEALNTREGKERELRDRFGVVKEGEKLIILVDDDSLVKTGKERISDSWWRKFLDAIGQ